MSPWDFINSINTGHNDLFEDPQAEKDYVPFIVNRALSQSSDTIMYANEVNLHSGIPKRWQYDFLRLAVPKRKRYNKWAKKETLSDDLAAVCSFYKYNEEKGAAALSLLNEQQIAAIKLAMDKGGKS